MVNDAATPELWQWQGRATARDSVAGTTKAGSCAPIIRPGAKGSGSGTPIFAPHERPADAIGELWAIHFDGESRRIVAGKAETLIARCAFANAGLDVRIDDATLAPGRLRGHVSSPGTLRWDLAYDGGGPPLLFLPAGLYDTRFPARARP